MSQKVSQTLIAGIVVILVVGILNNGLWNRPTESMRVIEIKQAVIMSDEQKINLFIDEMMNKRQGNCLKRILMEESNMRPHAKNKKSSAKGVGQLLESTYRNLGLKHSADPIAQVVAAIAYGGRHYGGSNAFCKAWAFHQKHNYW